MLLQKRRVAGGDCAKGEFLLPGNAQFVGEKDVERRSQGFCDFKGDGDASAGYSEDEDVVRIGKLLQLVCQPPSGVFAVLEDHCSCLGVAEPSIYY